MSLTARHLALQGFLLTPISMAVQGLLAIDEEVLPPAPVGNDDGFNPPYTQRNLQTSPTSKTPFAPQTPARHHIFGPLIGHLKIVQLFA
jgi:hypothetical protein